MKLILPEGSYLQFDLLSINMVWLKVEWKQVYKNGNFTLWCNITEVRLNGIPLRNKIFYNTSGTLA